MEGSLGPQLGIDAPQPPFHVEGHAPEESHRPQEKLVGMRTVARLLAHTVDEAPHRAPLETGELRLVAGELEGIGVSPGVVEGRIRQLGSQLPTTLGPDDILVMPAFEIAHVPLGLAVAGVITETGGALAPGAEAVRNLGRPAVFSVENASLHLYEGERVRLDGERGTIMRLDVDRAAPPLSVRREAVRRP